MSRLNHLALMKAQFVHQAILGDLHGGAPGGFCAHARVRQLLPFRFQGGFPHATMRQPLKNDMAPAANDEQNGKKTMVFAKEHDLRTGGGFHIRLNIVEFMALQSGLSQKCLS